ncbi:MAG: hypothetical protein A2X31_01130 [Elusimicrobia bacterium GWB2_63_22]|nr:MAG: hypothetical protein A2X31_01130 [Elusimicrobia bacterium GWB2_63_22]
MKGKVIKAGLFGSPLDKSLSPELFGIFGRLAGTAISYELRDVPRSHLRGAIDGARLNGWAGFNVTLPYKQEVCALLSQADPAAKAAGAVNAVRFGRTGLEGNNTDAHALREIFCERGMDPAGRAAAVYGAGGAAGAAGWALGRSRASSVVFYARNTQAAGALAARLGDCFPGTAFSTAPFEGPAAGDIFVNATPLGMYTPGRPPCAPGADSFCFDMAYAPGGTEFGAAAEKAGATVVDGLELLVWQAVLALKFWSGLPTGDIVKFKQEALALLRSEKGF